MIHRDRLGAEPNKSPETSAFGAPKTRNSGSPSKSVYRYCKISAGNPLFLEIIDDKESKQKNRTIFSAQYVIPSKEEAENFLSSVKHRTTRVLNPM